MDGLPISDKHYENNSYCGYLVRPKPQHHVERYNLKGNENCFEHKEIDSHCKSNCRVDEMVSKANLEARV